MKKTSQEPNYQKISDKYQELTQKAADPKNLSKLKKIGQKLSELKPLAEKAKKILSLQEQIKENKQLASKGEENLAQLAKQELKKLSQTLKDLKKDFKKTQKLQNSDPQDKKPAILEFRAAAGGDEAKIWKEDLKRMYIRFAETQNLKVKAIEKDTIQISGKPKNLKLTGPYGIFKHEAGVHRVQRIPETETQGRIHTSTASLAVIPKVKTQEISIKEDELDWQFFRSGGHGGQNVNKVSTAVRLTHKPTDITIVSTQERSQQRNREIALELLRSKLWKNQEEKRQQKLKSTRSSAVGRGMRAEKIRTYNFPQNRVTDHRINQSWHNLEEILDGKLTELTLALQKI